MNQRYSSNRRNQFQPYNYEQRSQDHRNRARNPHSIEYQDDSLSSINSEEESYIPPTQSKKDKKNFYHNPSESVKQKPDKSEVKASSSDPSTSDRLQRLETMLEHFLKQQTDPGPKAPLERPAPPADVAKYTLDPRRHDFTTSKWINKIQEISVLNSWDEKTTIRFMEKQMSGQLKAWYNTLPVAFTWPELKILLTKIFPDNVDFVTTLKRLVTRLKQPDENIVTYYFSKMYLIDACKITGEDAVSCLIDGLNNQEVQERARHHNFLTPESLYSQFLSLLPDYTVDYAPALEEPGAWYSDVESPKKYKDEPPAGGLKPSGNVHSRLDTRFIKPQYRGANKLPLAAITCTNCNNRGHHARNCHTVLYCTGPSAGLETQRCWVNGVECAGLVDSGSTVTVLTERIACQLGLGVEGGPQEHYLRVYGGGSVGIKGQVEVELRVDGVQRKVQALVVADEVQDVPVLVGQSFIHQDGVRVVLERNSWRIFDDFRT